MSKRTSTRSDKTTTEDTEEQKILSAQQEFDFISLFAVPNTVRQLEPENVSSTFKEDNIFSSSSIRSVQQEVDLSSLLADPNAVRQLVSENIPSTFEEDNNILSSSPLSPILSENFPLNRKSSDDFSLDQSLSLKKAKRKNSVKLVTLGSEQAVPQHQQQVQKHQSLRPFSNPDSSVVPKVPTATTKEATVSVIIEEPKKSYSGARSSSKVSSVTTTVELPLSVNSSTKADQVTMVDGSPRNKHEKLELGLAGLFCLMCSCCRKRKKDKENKEDEEAGLQNNSQKPKSKRRRNFCCCLFILVIIILFLLAGLIWLIVHARTPAVSNNSSSNNATSTNTTSTTKISPNASFCLSSFNALVSSQTENFPCDTCGSDGTFYNITQFCVFKGIWANAPNKTALESHGWMQSKDFCEWSGVICDNSGNTIELDLKDPIIPNVLTDDIGRLNTLQKLTISGTLEEPSGNLPEGLFNLTNLNLLNIQFTSFNNLPDSFNKLTSLKSLTLSQNSKLGSSIPSSIGALSLTSLTISGQGLTGNIPDFISNSKPLQSSLNVLDLSANNLTGSIPSSLSQFSSLITLNLEVNNLTSQMPDFSTYASAKSLHNLQLDGNGITGQIPTSISGLTNLVVLRLQNNQLSGGIPTQIGSMSSLQELNLSHNQLTGNIPSSVAALKAPKIDLSANSLSGTIPSSMCQNNYDLCNLSSNNLTNSGKCGVCLT